MVNAMITQEELDRIMESRFGLKPYERPRVSAEGAKRIVHLLDQGRYEAWRFHSLDSASARQWRRLYTP